MWVDLESSLRAAITGALRMAQVFGSMQFVDMQSEDAPAIAVQIAWLGFSPTGQKPDALAGTHQFVVRVMCNALRVKPAETRAVAEGLDELHKRLIAWRPRPELPDEYAEIDQSGVVDAGQIWTYEITLTVPGYKIRASS